MFLYHFHTLVTFILLDYLRDLFVQKHDDVINDVIFVVNNVLGEDHFEIEGFSDLNFYLLKMKTDPAICLAAHLKKYFP